MNVLTYFSRFPYFLEFLKSYGLSKTLKRLFYYRYRSLKRKSLDYSTQLVKVNGYKMKVLPGDKGISEELLMFKTHEPITTKLISNELKEEMVCLDLGANIGYYALLESNIIGNSGKVIAIEPSPDNFEKLIQNLNLNCIKNVIPFNIACGDKNGEIPFLVSKKSNLCTIIDKNYVKKSSDNIIDVPIKKIDDFLNENKIEKVDFVRMDVEGYEGHIIKGMQKTLDKNKPILHIEVHRQFMSDNQTRELLDEFQKRGYECKYYHPRALDHPTIGSLDDVKQLTIVNLLSMLESRKLPMVFFIFLLPKK